MYIAYAGWLPWYVGGKSYRLPGVGILSIELQVNFTDYAYAGDVLSEQLNKCKILNERTEHIKVTNVNQS